MTEAIKQLAAQLDLNEEADDASTAQVADIFALLLKGIKNINIYKHAEARYREFLEPAHRAMAKFLDDNGILPLKLQPYQLEFKKRVIYEEQTKENLTYKFYKDGMRFLMFRQGLPAEELLEFVVLATDNYSEQALFQEDTITRLWKRNFQFIEYIVVESFAFGDLSPEEVEFEVDKIVAYLRKQLAANSDDVSRFARIDIEDLELQLSDVEQVRGGIISGRPAKDDDKQQVQTEIYLEEKKRLFAKMVLVLFQILEFDCTPDDFDMLSEAFSQVLDSLILQEDVRGTVAVLQRLDMLVARTDVKPAQQQLTERIRESFVKRMVEPERLQAVGQYMTLAKKIDEVAVRQYFAVTPSDRLSVILDVLLAMERQDGRKILIDVLADLAKNHTEIFVEHLKNNSSVVVKTILAIIDKINPPNKVDLYAKILEHPNIMIRLEGLKVIGKDSSDRAIKYLEAAIEDEDLQIRLGAYRALANKGAKRAVPLLKKVLTSEDFTTRDKREQVAVVSALGETRTPEAIEAFRAVLSVKASLFQRGKANEAKLMAIRGLQAMGTVEAYNALAREVQAKHNSKDVAEAAHKVALKLKEDLTANRQPKPVEAAEE